MWLQQNSKLCLKINILRNDGGKMVQAKTEVFEQEDVFLANLAKALAHPVRIKILKILNEENVCMCGEIVELLPLAQSTVSQHLKELKKVGLIRGEIDGPKICYCLDENIIGKAREMFTKLFISIKCC
jgi:DNA-binding transcriptional ArsR family regulator